MIDYSKELNPAQLEAVTTVSGPVLVIAGAGSGKTRTIVYRLTYLVEQGVLPEQILLLTFTRKAAGEMIARAEQLLGRVGFGVSGGTFHSFACRILKKFIHVFKWDGFSVIDPSDGKDILKQAKAQLNLTKHKTFPKVNTIYDLISKSRNKEISLEEMLTSQGVHLLPFLEDIEKMASYYQQFKLKHHLLDYDDLLFYLEKMLVEQTEIRLFLAQRFPFVMVDEFQDTNRIQGRLIKLLAGEQENVMAVGDDAQSIYGFRGSTVENILNFPKVFVRTKVIKLEQNYRSTQPILALTNHILQGAKEKYAKKLFSTLEDKTKPEIIYPSSDLSQAQVVVKKIRELSSSYAYNQIAVLFRAGYQSYSLELELSKMGIKFQKFGGQKFSESAHIKDILAFVRLVVNPYDLPGWIRALSNVRGIGPKTIERLYTCFVQGEEKQFKKICQRYPELEKVMLRLNQIKQRGDLSPQEILTEIIDIYQPFLESKFVDDLPKRQAGLEQLVQIAAGYDNLELFLTDLLLEPIHQDRVLDQDVLTLSTIHSAKGLEWDCVLILDLVENKFPSRHALADPKELEEERRLLYVACTRAKRYLGLFVPKTVYNKYYGGFEPAKPSPFIKEIPDQLVVKFEENYFGQIYAAHSEQEKVEKKQNVSNELSTQTGTICFHKIFGRGRIIAHVPPNKYQVNFSEHGLKTIIGDYLEFE